jgi:hypothetical protein
MKKQEHSNPLLLALDRNDIDDQELQALLSLAEEENAFTDPERAGLVDLINEFGEAQKNDNEMMIQELTAEKEAYNKALIAGRRQAIKKALLLNRSKMDASKTQAMINRIKKNLP